MTMPLLSLLGGVADDDDDQQQPSIHFSPINKRSI